MFYGSPYFKPVSGSWNEQVGYLFFNPTLSTGQIIRRGAFLDYKVGSTSEADVGSGTALGFMCQDMTPDGLTILNFAVVNNPDYPLAPGQYVSLRKPSILSEFEVEGLGTAAAFVTGNLLVTSGTGAIASGTARGTALSVKNGCWYIAQTGDFILGELISGALTPEIGGNVRALIRYLGGAAKA